MGLSWRWQTWRIPFVRANVGDRYVIAELLERNWQVGGENSGHVVCFQHTTTGDAIIAALQVLMALCVAGRAWLRLVRLCASARRYCSTCVSQVEKTLSTTRAVKEACERATLAMAGRGRVLLRKSGTEPLVRVMVEGDDETQVRGHAEDLAKLVTEVSA